MSQWADAWVIPWMTFLADWSLRWALILAPLALWLVAKPPGRASIRHLLCLSALAAGLLLPFGPRWNVAAIPGRPSRPIGAPASPSANGPDVPAKPVSLPSATAKGEAPSGPASPTRPTAAADPVRSISWGKLAVLALATVWTIAVLVMLARLAFGWRLLNRLRREAIEIDGSDASLLGECREALGLVRAVKIAVHPAVASPVVVGGFRPVVLVPPDWNDWPVPHRRACLLHELAHLARYDDWARLGQEPIRAVFWFHPLVHWLLNRLDRERELLCDEAAVGLGSDPVAYARLLLNLARRPVRLIPSVLSAPHGSLPFLDRRTVGLRIHRLLEETMPRRFTHGSRPRSILAGSLIAALAIGLGGPRLVPISAQQPQTASSRRLEPKELRGIVVDLDDQPIAGATVIAGTRESGPQILTTDREGRFVWEAPEGASDGEIVAYKPGQSATVQRTLSRVFWDRHEMKLWLETARPAQAKLVDVENNPVVGAHIRIRKLLYEYKSDDKRLNAFTGDPVGSTYVVETTTRKSDGTVSITKGRLPPPPPPPLQWTEISIPWEILAGTPMTDLAQATTGQDGSFAFDAFQPRTGFLLEITNAEGLPLQIKAQRSLVERSHGYEEREGFITPREERQAELVVISTARLTGRVVSRVPGIGVTDLWVRYESDPMIGDATSHNDHSGATKTDADGRFQFDRMSDGTVTLSVESKEKHKNWTFRPVRNIALASGRTTEVEIELIPGAEVVGTVIARDTGRPLEHATVNISSPIQKPYVFLSLQTDAQGRYTCRLPTPDLTAYVMTLPDGYIRGPGNTSTCTATIPEGAEQVQVPPIKLEPTYAIRGIVLDADGSPVVGVKFMGYHSNESNHYVMRRLQRVSDAQGKFTMPTSYNGMLTEGTPTQLVVRLADGTEQVVTVVAKDHEIVVRLAGKP